MVVYGAVSVSGKRKFQRLTHMKMNRIAREWLAFRREKKRLSATHEFIDLDPYHQHMWDAIEDVQMSASNGVWVKWKLGIRQQHYNEDLHEDMQEYMRKRACKAG